MVVHTAQSNYEHGLCNVDFGSLVSGLSVRGLVTDKRNTAHIDYSWASEKSSTDFNKHI